MLLKEEISRIKKIMNLSEGLFDDFNISDFKKMDPPSNNSEETKKELEYLKSIDIDKRFVQEKDDITGNFFKFLEDYTIIDIYYARFTNLLYLDLWFTNVCTDAY